MKELKILKTPKIYWCVFFIWICAIGCGRGPKIISSPVNEASDSSPSGVFSTDAAVTMNPALTNDLHTVIVNEVLPTDKYVYLNVTEGKEQFWIATTKKEVEVGQTYFYKGGLLKTNFESKEYNRIFDKIYLVSNVVEANHGNTQGAIAENPKQPNLKPQDHVPTSTPGSITIASLVAQPENFEGTVIQLSGTCVKLNSNIMGRNWIHLKDGTQDDYDLVLTSNFPVQEGAKVTMKGTVSLDRDFGAGYLYDIIVENAVVVN